MVLVCVIILLLCLVEHLGGLKNECGVLSWNIHFFGLWPLGVFFSFLFWDDGVLPVYTFHIIHDSPGIGDVTFVFIVNGVSVIEQGWPRNKEQGTGHEELWYRQRWLSSSFAHAIQHLHDSMLSQLKHFFCCTDVVFDDFIPLCRWNELCSHGVEIMYCVSAQATSMPIQYRCYVQQLQIRRAMGISTTDNRGGLIAARIARVIITVR